MKTKTLLIAAAMLLCFSAASFAQSIFSTSSTPITTVIATGNAELTGNITFTGTGTSIAGTIQIQYGGNNVNITTDKSNIMVQKDGAVVPGLQVDLGATVYSPGLLVIDVPAGLAPTTGTTYAITVSRVRVQINGTGLTNLVANISATGNLIQAGSTAVTVINSTTGVGIASATTYTAPASLSGTTTTPAGGSPTLPIDFTGTSYSTVTPVINQVNGLPSDGIAFPRTVAITIKEGFLAAFTQGVGVRITLNANPPKGVTFGFPGSATSYAADKTVVNPNWVRGGSTSWGNTGSSTTIDVDSNSLSVYYYVNSDTNNDPVNIEYLEIPVTITSAPGSETFPLNSKSFTYTVSLAPVRDAYSSSGTPRTIGNPLFSSSTSDSPRFAALETPASPLVSIGGGNTVLFVPYAYASKTAGDFNTAMSVSNTTEDPGSTNLGFTGAVPQSGPIAFYLFPTDTTLPMFTYKTTAGSPGSGLDASGNIAAGGTYIVFLSQIFPLATPPSGSTATLGNTFIGYVMIVTNFTNGHGLFTISNFTTLTAQSSLMQVLGDRSVLPEK